MQVKAVNENARGYRAGWNVALESLDEGFERRFTRYG
jgi:hypothetical protein